MKKRMGVIYLLFAAAILSACGNTAANQNDAEETAVLDETNAETTAEETVFSGIGDYTLKLPVFGVTAYDVYTDPTDLFTSYRYRNHQFDEKSNLVSYEELQNNRPFKVWDLYQKEYDENGNLITDTEDGNNPDIRIFTYNEMNECTAERKDTGKNPYTRDYTYDDKGMINSYEYRDENNHFITKYEYEYDELGRVIKQRNIDESEGVQVIENEYEIEYNDTNLPVVILETLYQDGSVWSQSESHMSYDSYGHLILRTTNSVGDDDDPLRGEVTIEAVSEREVSSVGSEILAAAADWKAFPENEKIPTPDSVFPALCTEENETSGNEYRYMLKTDPFDYSKCMRMLDMPVDYAPVWGISPEVISTQTSVNEALGFYQAVLTQLLGFEVKDLGEGKYSISKDGIAAAQFACEWQNGACYLSFDFN